jgi:DNA/RNA-binding domain of Phe-tRNA-synthetase-like protein
LIEDPDIALGYVEEALAREFPQLRLAYTVVDAEPRRSPPEVVARLRHASDRFTGGRAITLRQQPVPHAYRVFFRYIGIDPDEQRTPVEAIAVERMRAGGFRSAGLVDDALLLATLETGVPLQAFDAAAIDGELGLRLTRAGEALDEFRPLSSGQVVVADARRPLAVVFGDVAARVAVGRVTRRVALSAIRVAGVPGVSVEEALWTAVEILTKRA